MTALLQSSACAVLLVLTATLPAADLTQRIDDAIAARLAEAGISPAGQIDDAGFLRRVTLDLAGRVPTRRELAEFLAIEAPDRRQQLVARLLESPDFDVHLRNSLDIQLLARVRRNNDFREFLLEACQENRGWDRIFRDLVLPEVHQSESKGATAFLGERIRDLDTTTNDVSILFFGVNIACAKCHDHPLVTDWKQDHYFGMTRFLTRTYRMKSGQLGERFTGDVKFTTTAGEEKQAEFLFLSGERVTEPESHRPEEELKQLNELIKQAERDDKAPQPPQPEFSPRAEFVRMALEIDRGRLLARNIVNRTWERLLGYGLVMPLDQMHSGNLPSHPELLDDLAAAFIESGYDLRELTRWIVLSDVYARSSRCSSDAELPPHDLFAVAVPRALTNWQLSLSLTVATSSPDRLPGWILDDEWQKLRTDLENRSGRFAGRFEIPEDRFQVGAEEALMFSNGQDFDREFLRDSSDRLVGWVNAQVPANEQVPILFQTILTRDPTEVERRAFEEYLQSRNDRPVAALQQITWALLTSPEFRFNH